MAGIVWSFAKLLVQGLGLYFGLLYPAAQSVKAIESASNEDDTLWLIYWLIFSLFTIFESVAWPLLQWLPLYNVAKVLLFAWLVLPQTKGALWVYEALLSPALTQLRTELAKFPALEKLIAQAEDANTSVDRTSEENQAAISNRSSNLASTVKEVSSSFEADLQRISGITDQKARARAENAFDKDLGRLSKISTARQAGSTGKLFQGSKMQ